MEIGKVLVVYAGLVITISTECARNVILTVITAIFNWHVSVMRDILVLGIVVQNVIHLVRLVQLQVPRLVLLAPLELLLMEFVPIIVVLANLEILTISVRAVLLIVIFAILLLVVLLVLLDILEHHQVLELFHVMLLHLQHLISWQWEDMF